MDVNYLFSSYPEARDPRKAENPLSDLAVARTYLVEMAKMCAKAAQSADPREVWLALGVAENRDGERMRRSRETYALECSSCQRAVELSTIPPHRCPACGSPLEIQWR